MGWFFELWLQWILGIPGLTEWTWGTCQKPVPPVNLKVDGHPKNTTWLVGFDPYPYNLIWYYNICPSLYSFDATRFGSVVMNSRACFFLWIKCIRYRSWHEGPGSCRFFRHPVLKHGIFGKRPWAPIEMVLQWYAGTSCVSWPNGVPPNHASFLTTAVFTLQLFWGTPHSKKPPAMPEASTKKNP